VRLFAQEVAEAYCEAMQLHEQPRIDEVEMIALVVGSYLADEGRPGAWANIDVDELMNKWIPEHPTMRGTFAATLIDVLTWLVEVGELPFRAARACCKRLHAYRDGMEGAATRPLQHANRKLISATPVATA
jgi:hypothetical protein